MPKITYQQYRDARQKEVNDLPLFFAFSREQFEEELRKRNATEKDVYKLLGSSGAFYLKKDAPILRAAFSKKNILPELMQDHDFAVDAFLYEMNNHEYAINWQADWDVCNCFCEKECIYGEDKTYVDYLKEAGHQDWIAAYKEAKRKHYKMAEENDWF